MRKFFKEWREAIRCVRLYWHLSKSIKLMDLDTPEDVELARSMYAYMKRHIPKPK